MSETIVFLSKGKIILRNTMMKLGYDQETSALAIWSALWLQNRSFDGITQLIVYLCLINERPFSDLLPRKHPEFGLTGICPFHIAMCVFERWERDDMCETIALGAPASPLLSMPLITEQADGHGRSVRLHHREYSCLFSQNGFDLESETVGMFGWVDTDSDLSMMITRVPDKLNYSIRSVDQISLPTRRLQQDDTLYLGSPVS